MTLPLVIVNPASAGGATARAWPSIASELRRHFGAFACAFTAASGDASRIAQEEARGGRRFIIACGGDGTVSEVAGGIMRSGVDAELGILPSGTGGDFRRTLDISTRAADAARALRTGKTRPMDVGRVEFTDEAGERESRFFLNVASFGMGGEVIKRVKDESSLPARSARLFGGRLSFALAALQTNFTYAKPAVSVSLDGSEFSRLVVTNFCVANARYFGGGMKVAPDARIDDGRFDVVSIGDMDALSILANSYRVYLGTHLGLQHVRHAHARRVEAKPFSAGDQIELEIDGELRGRLPAAFEILPHALRIRCP